MNKEQKNKLRIHVTIWWGLTFLLGFSIGYYTAAREAAQMILENLK